MEHEVDSMPDHAATREAAIDWATLGLGAQQLLIKMVFLALSQVKIVRNLSCVPAMKGAPINVLLVPFWHLPKLP